MGRQVLRESLSDREGDPAISLPPRIAHKSEVLNMSERLVTPASRYRRRADGGYDETYRLTFIDQLEPAQLRAIVDILVNAPSVHPDVGILALTKIEFLEPDTCDVRYWCTGSPKQRVNSMLGIWSRISRVSRIGSVDTLPYTLPD